LLQGHLCFIVSALWLSTHQGREAAAGIK
jgi:hypothetical protein